MKDPENPHLVHIVHESIALPYAWADVLKSLPLQTLANAKRRHGARTPALGVHPRFEETASPVDLELSQATVGEIERLLHEHDTSLMGRRPADGP
jgi:hypothetical protein